MRILNKEIVEIMIIAIVLILLIIIDILLYVKCGKSFSKKDFVAVLGVLDVIVISTTFSHIAYFPHQKVFHFKNSQEMFQYYYPKEKVRKIYDYQDFVFYVYSNKEENGVTYFKLKNGRWNWDFDESKGFRVIDKYTIFIDNIKDKNMFSIAICYTDNHNSKISISDSESSKFDRISTKINSWAKEQEYNIMYFTILEERPTEDYMVTINNKTYKVLEMNKKKK